MIADCSNIIDPIRCEDTCAAELAGGTMQEGGPVYLIVTLSNFGGFVPI